MASIDEIIKREVNPFDPTTFKQGHFWLDNQDSALTVESIHQEAIAEIDAIVDLVAKDHRSRTVMLAGDSGSGKSYLLGRLKNTLNPKAFFAYISPWPNSDGIWRHILRYTVDSLMNVPEGQKESQLMLWLKNLAVFKKLSMKELIFNESVWNLLSSDRQKFIKKLKDAYKQAGIYNADSFFGVLHDLTNPELDSLACEWLRGEDLSEESLQALKVKKSIQTEAAACEILSNFGRVSTETQPIVLCFDQLEAIARLPDGSLDLQALFSVNSKIQNEKWKNFVVIISITTDIWKHNSNRIHQSDKAGIYKPILLKRINLDQAEALWAFRLHPIHSQVNPQPDSKIYPLHRQDLEQRFPGGKTDPRNALDLGRKLFQTYKEKINNSSSSEIDLLAAFKLLWQDEHRKIKDKITKITLFSAPELIRMLEESLNALKIREIKPKFLSGYFASYSLSYQQPDARNRIGVIWTEDSHMKSFYHAMNACQGAVNQNLCQHLYLIRDAGLGDVKLAGHKIYKQIFQNSHHRHIKPNLSSVHYLATYHNLANSALANELTIAGKTINLQALMDLIYQSEIWQNCSLLQDLGIVSTTIGESPNEVKDFLLNVVKTQGYMGKSTLIENADRQFSQVNQTQVEELIQQLLQENKIQLVNPQDPLPEQLICLVLPQA